MQGEQQIIGLEGRDDRLYIAYLENETVRLNNKNMVREAMILFLVLSSVTGKYHQRVLILAQRLIRKDKSPEFIQIIKDLNKLIHEEDEI